MNEKKTICNKKINTSFYDLINLYKIDEFKKNNF